MGFSGNRSLQKARSGKYMKGTFFMHAVMGGFAQVDAQIKLVSDKDIMIKYTIWDHFGAGKSDAVSGLPGLPSLYWLQHNSEYNNILLKNFFTPFLWSVDVNRTIKKN